MSTTGDDNGGSGGYESAHGSVGGATDSVLWRAVDALREWRNTRPFWGGLLVFFGGAVILLSEQAPIPVIIHIGLQGLAGYLIPLVMVLCAVLLLVNPVQRTFYALLAVVLALASWITSNLGGFFVGMLLGVIGGSLAFAWEQRDGQVHRVGLHRRNRGEWLRTWLRRQTPSAGLSLILGPQRNDTEELPFPADDEPGGSGFGDDRERDQGGGGGFRLWAVSVAVAAAIMTAGSLPHQSGHSSGPVTPRPAEVPARPRPAWGTPSDLTAKLAVLRGLSFDGVAELTTARGRVRLLKFSMRSLTLSGTTFRAVVGPGLSVMVGASSLSVRGNVVLLARQISGRLDGTVVTYTVQRPPLSVPGNVVVANLVATRACMIGSAVQEVKSADVGMPG